MTIYLPHLTRSREVRICRKPGVSYRRVAGARIRPMSGFIGTCIGRYCKHTPSFIPR